VSWLRDPRIFSYIVMTLYLANAARWAFEKKPADVCYWLSALAIISVSDSI